MQALKYGAAYFGIVFAVGFALGLIRVLWIVPQVGVTWAELMEAPLMLVATVLAARWTVRRFRISAAVQPRLAMGLVALGMLGCAELAMVWLRGLTLAQYVATRDPVSGSVYVALLVVFAVMPLLVARPA